MKKLTSLTAMLLGLAFAATALAAADKTDNAAGSPDQVAGVWNLSVEYSGGTGSPVFTLKQDGEKLSGHYVGALGEADVTGTIKEHAIRFGFTLAGQSEPVTYSGAVDGETMKGKVTLGSMGEGTFTGKRQPAK